MGTHCVERQPGDMARVLLFQAATRGGGRAMRNLTEHYSQWLMPNERLIPVLLIPTPHCGMIAFVDACNNLLNPAWLDKQIEMMKGEDDEGGG